MPWGLTFSVDGVSGWRIGVEQPEVLERFNLLLHHLVMKTPEMVEWSGYTVILHHSIHDIPVLLELGVDIRDLPILDTMMMAYELCVEPQGLKALGWRWLRYWMTEYKEIADPQTEHMTRAYLEKALEKDWDKCTVCGQEGGLGKKHQSLTDPLNDTDALFVTFPELGSIMSGPFGVTPPWLTPKGNIKKKFLPYVNWCEGGNKDAGVPLNKKLRAIVGPVHNTSSPVEIDDNEIPF